MRSRTHPLNPRQRADLYLQLAALEEAGLPYAAAFGMVNLSAPGFAEVARGLQARLKRGTDLATAGEYCGVFSSFDAALLRAALASGHLSQAYRRLAGHYEAQARRIGAVKSRLVLPAAVLVLATFIQPLPDLVLGHVDGLGYLRHILFQLAGYALAAYAGFRLPVWLREGFLQPFKPHADALWLRVPWFGPMHLRRNLRDFVASLGCLLEAGMAMEDGVKIAMDSIGNHQVHSRFAILPRLILRGSSLAEALQALPFPGGPEAMYFISSGEAAGRLPEMLLRYRDREDEAIASFDTQVAEWVPRVVYAAIAAMMAASILGSGAFMPSAEGVF